MRRKGPHGSHSACPPPSCGRAPATDDFSSCVAASAGRQKVPASRSDARRSNPSVALPSRLEPGGIEMTVPGGGGAVSPTSTRGDYSYSQRAVKMSLRFLIIGYVCIAVFAGEGLPLMGGGGGGG
jgi:hypothetical protein